MLTLVQPEFLTMMACGTSTRAVPTLTDRSRPASSTPLISQAEDARHGLGGGD